MTVFSKVFLSGSTNGKGILLAGTTSGSSTVIHRAVTGTEDMDEVWIYLVNQDTETIAVTIEFGSASDQDKITISLAAQVGMQFVIPGLVLNNNLYIKGYATTANKITAHGFVNRIAP